MHSLVDEGRVQVVLESLVVGAGKLQAQLRKQVAVERLQEVWVWEEQKVG